MIRTKFARWNAAAPGGFADERGFAARPSAPREIPLERDLVALLLAEDARSKPRELWLGLGFAAATVALFASGAGIPLLAAAFCLAPFVGIGLEIFGSDDRREA